MTDTYSIQYFTRGKTYNLNGYDADHGLTLHYLGDQGFGLAPLHRITTRGPLQHGDSDIDFRLDPRILQIPLVVKNESASPKFNSYAIREALLNIFRPQDVGVLSVVRSDGVTTHTRSIIVKVLGGLTFDVDPVDYHVRTVVQLRADDPTWYDDSTTSLITAQANFGVSQSTSSAGNWQTFPSVFTVAGPVTTCRIENKTYPTAEKFIEVTGTIAAGTTYYFDLRYGYKTVHTGPNQTGTNVINLINPASDLATWAIYPGANFVRITGTGLSAATLVSISWQNRYTGI